VPLLGYLRDELAVLGLLLETVFFLLLRFIWWLGRNSRLLRMTFVVIVAYLVWLGRSHLATFEFNGRGLDDDRISSISPATVGMSHSKTDVLGVEELERIRTAIFGARALWIHLDDSYGVIACQLGQPHVGFSTDREAPEEYSLQLGFPDPKRYEWASWTLTRHIVEV
jgi:hypothetical protein